MHPALTPGFHALPAGHLAAVVTHLAREGPPPPRGPREAALSLARLGPGEGARFLALFRAVGAPWLWWSRLAWPPAATEARLEDAEVETFALVRRGADGVARDVGLLELDFGGGGAELAFFGLVPDETGRGSGRALMDEALARRAARGEGPLTVHTCTLDSPAALPFYLRSGFRVTRRAVEVMPDPRLTGLLPRDAAPGVAVLGTSSEVSVHPSPPGEGGAVPLGTVTGGAGGGQLAR